MPVAPHHNPIIGVATAMRNLESPIAYGLKAKIIAVLYVAFMLALISFMTLPSNLFGSIPLIMFIVNSCLLFFIYSDLRIFANSIFGSFGAAILTAIGMQAVLFVALTGGDFRWVSFFFIPFVFLAFILTNRRHPSRSNVAIRVIDVIVLAAISSITATFAIFHRNSYPVDSVQHFINLPTDIPLFGSMIQSIVGSGISETGFVAGYSLRYHWLAYGFLSSLDQGSFLDLIPLLAHFTPILLFFTSLLLVAGISSVTWMSPLSPVIGILGVLSLGFVGVWRNADIPVFPWFSPSTLLGGGLILAISLIIQRLLTTGLNWGGLLLVFLLSNFIFLAKISAGFILISGLVLLSFYLWVSRRRIPREAIFLVVLVGLVGASWYLLLFSGTGNEIQLDPVFGEISETGIPSIINFGVPLAALVAILVPWAGVLIRDSPAGRLELEQAWAVCLGIPALSIYALTTAPDQNDRFFVIAASIVIFPISFLAAVRFIATRFSRDHRRKLFVFFSSAATVSLILYILAHLEFFDLRPLIFPVLTFLLACSLGLILRVRNTSKTSQRKNYLHSCLASLVAVSFFFSIYQFMGLQFSNPVKDASEYVISGTRDRIEKYIDLTTKQSSRYNAIDGKNISFLIQGADSNTVERWVRFASEQPTFSSGETDLRRLSSQESEVVILRRNQEILQFYETRSSSLGKKLCQDGLSEIWVYNDVAETTGSNSLFQSSHYDLDVVSLNCLSSGRE